MANQFADQLRAELTGIDAEVTRLENKRRLIRELLDAEGGSAPKAAAAPKQTRRPAARRSASPPAKRQRRPRGLITNKVREFLHKQSEPVHATEILAFLEKNDAAPQSAKPMPTLQSTLQRMKELGEIENRGRNRWALKGNGGDTNGEDSSPPALSPAAPTPVASTPPPAPRAETPPVVTSTTTFGNRPTFQ